MQPLDLLGRVLPFHFPALPYDSEAGGNFVVIQPLGRGGRPGSAARPVPLIALY